MTQDGTYIFTLPDDRMSALNQAIIKAGDEIMVAVQAKDNEKIERFKAEMQHLGEFKEFLEKEGPAFLPMEQDAIQFPKANANGTIMMVLAKGGDKIVKNEEIKKALNDFAYKDNPQDTPKAEYEHTFLTNVFEWWEYPQAVNHEQAEESKLKGIIKLRNYSE